jgi:DNA-binding LacI/PurR family transcriptional regulator
VASAADRSSTRAPRIRDVAERAGVGVGTVSRVLNDSPGVARATRDRVRAVVDELGYRPSASARRLSLGRTMTLGVVAPFFTRPSVVERLRGIDDVIGDSPYDLMLFNVETPEQRAAALTRFARRDRVDGVIVISLPLADAEVRALRRDGVRAVVVDGAHRALPHVTIDDVEGGRMAVRHLLDAGHRRVAFVGDREGNPFGFGSSQRRLAGMTEVLAAAGLELPPERVRRGPHGRAAAHAMTAELLALVSPPTAIFAASDVQALGVLDAAAEAGVDVPGALSVVGFDDIDLADAAGLTTVRQPLRESGRAGARLLLSVLGDERAKVAPLPAVQLVRRRTVGRHDERKTSVRA